MLNLKVIFLCLFGVSAIHAACDWVKIGNKEYCFNSNTLIWNDAKAFCMTEGGKLFEPRDATENSEVSEYAFNNGLNIFWFGIEDEPVSPEGTWVYASDGSPLEYTNWKQGEPNNLGDEDCGEIGWVSNDSWNDDKCATLLGSVCEKSGSPPPNTGACIFGIERQHINPCDNLDTNENTPAKSFCITACNSNAECNSWTYHEASTTCSYFTCQLEVILTQYEEIGGPVDINLNDCLHPQLPSQTEFDCVIDSSLEIFQSPSDDAQACQDICASVPDQCKYWIRNVDGCKLYSSDPIDSCDGSVGSRTD